MTCYANLMMDQLATTAITLREQGCRCRKLDADVLGTSRKQNKLHVVFHIAHADEQCPLEACYHGLVLDPDALV